ncbi:class I SAM-dependent methyltransferase [Desulfobotulus mexicanus]|nr:class I SAM-dependent methyltransferase [Desulfobotulus mexicanus]
MKKEKEEKGSDPFFYKAFEERFRGPRELVYERLKVYLPFILPFKDIFSPCKALDLGCGRGEWLELLKNNGFEGRGADTDATMLSICNSRELCVEQKDALDTLSQTPNESMVLVTAFHLAEHLQPDQLLKLFHEASRVLHPGGLLIIETPNPENLRVATRDFYVDLTHRKPLPSHLLEFMAEYEGFAQIKTIGLNENKALHQTETITLQEFFHGASPDYAIIAQKQGESPLMDTVQRTFKESYGIPLDLLAEKFEKRIIKAEQGWSHYNRVVESRSWKITRPIRTGNQKLSRAKTLFSSYRRRAADSLNPRKFFQKQVRQLATFTLSSPLLKKTATAFLNRIPGLEARIRQIIHGTGRPIVQKSAQYLSPRAGAIHQHLKQQIKKHRKAIK